MKINRTVAVSAVATLVAGSALVAIPANAATVEEVSGEYSAEFSIRNSINNTALQSLPPVNGPTDEGTHEITMTVSPAAAAAGDRIEIEVSSPTLAFRNGPIVGSLANSAEIGAVIELGGADYQLRGPAATVDTDVDEVVIEAGWTISSASGGSSGSTGATPATSGLGTIELNDTTAAPVSLTAPAGDGAYEVILKALVNNALTGTSNVAVNNPFDAIYGTAPAPDLIGGPEGYLQQNDPIGFFNFEAPSTPEPTPTDEPTTPPVDEPIDEPTTPAPQPPGDPDIDTSPRSTAAELDVYCGFVDFPLAPVVNETWPTSITVSPGAAAPGSTVQVTVEVDGTTLNGPVAIAAGDFRMEAHVELEGQSVELIGPANPDVGIEEPMFTDLPLVAEGAVTLPDAEGEFPITLTDIWYNYAVSPGSLDTYDDILDMRCNASEDPVGSPQSLGLTVEVLSDASAPRVDASPDGGPNSGPDGGVDGAGGDTAGGVGGDSTGPGGIDTLAETGPSQTLIAGLLALLAFQVGAMLVVRAVRSRPIRRH